MTKHILAMALGISVISTLQQSCSSDEDLDGYTTAQGDCDDSDREIFPGAIEYCDSGVDEDCDGSLDENDCFTARINKNGYDLDPDETGTGVSGVGDQDGDGVGDLLVAARLDQGTDCDNQCGIIYVISGTARGDWRVDDAIATIYGQRGIINLGIAIGEGGDLNGDGISDIVVAASSTEIGEPFFVFFGPVKGELSTLDADALLAHGSGTNQDSSIISDTGDINGDGYDDLVLGSPYRNTAYTDAGAAYIIYGPPKPYVYLFTEADAVILGNRESSWVGSSVSDAGDVNGDGYDDVLVGAANGNPAATLYCGPLHGTYYETDADATLGSRSGTEDLGYSVAIVKDMNGDGYDEVAVGDPNWGFGDTSECCPGDVELFYGPLQGDMRQAAHLAYIEGVDISHSFVGATLASPGDVDGDGLGDLLFGYKETDEYRRDTAAAALVLGPIEGTHSIVEVAHLLIPGAPISVCGANIGMAGYVHAAGDIDRDGRADIVFGGQTNCDLYSAVPGAMLRTQWQ